MPGESRRPDENRAFIGLPLEAAKLLGHAINVKCISASSSPVRMRIALSSQPYGAGAPVGRWGERGHC